MSVDLISNPQKAAVSTVTVEQYLTEWLFTYKRSEVAARTLEYYDNLFKARVYPAIGQIPISKLTSRDIQKIVAGMQEEGRKYATVKKVRDAINTAMIFAVENGVIPTNPVKAVKMPKRDRSVQSETPKAIPVEMRQRIIEACQFDDLMKPAIMTLLFTGMRVGEMLALPWSNMDLQTGIITIDRAITIKPLYKADGSKGERISTVETTKTAAGIRKLKMSKRLTETLKEWKELRRKRKPTLVKESAFVFATEKYELRTYNGFRTTYRRFLAMYALDNADLNLHRYRHTFATMMLEKGINPRVVQKMLGHEDIETTLGTYSHVLSEVYDGVADVLDDIYEDTVKGEYSPTLTME